MLYEIYPTESLAALLKTFKEVGGVIDYVLVGDISPGDFADTYAFHKAAAGFTIEAVSSRYPQSLEKGPASRREPEKAEGIQITPEEFFAPGYSGIPFELTRTLSRKQLEKERLKLDPNIFSPGVTGKYLNNYHAAFSYPPYHFQGLVDHEEERLFPNINRELFGNDENALTIYKWSTDWADYFNDGHEWWGSFLWTVYSTETQLLVGIAASTSD
jgi:hypothetical protein